jgi:cyclopropane fatty-acyl-phospholipid synthase-like methyltransferase
MLIQFVILFLMLLPVLVMLVLVGHALWGIYIVLQGAFFAVSRPERIDKILKLLAVKPGLKVADLGSGDGRVLVALAKAGVIAEGYEIDPLLIFQSRRLVKKHGLENKIKIHAQSYWSADLSKYDSIVVYGIGHIMKRLEKKLAQDLKPGTPVISNFFQFPNWQAKKKLGEVRLYVSQRFKEPKVKKINKRKV